MKKLNLAVKRLKEAQQREAKTPTLLFINGIGFMVGLYYSEEFIKRRLPGWFICYISPRLKTLYGGFR